MFHIFKFVNMFTDLRKGNKLHALARSDLLISHAHVM